MGISLSWIGMLSNFLCNWCSYNEHHSKYHRKPRTGSCYTSWYSHDCNCKPRFITRNYSHSKPRPISCHTSWNSHNYNYQSRSITCDTFHSKPRAVSSHTP